MDREDISESEESIWNKFRQLNVPIMWGTLLVGWQGFGCLRRLLSRGEVISYADNQLELQDIPTENLVSLACASDDRETENILKLLAARESFSPKREQIKWCVILLKDVLDELPRDHVEGLCAMTDFWASLDYPDYSPHIIQGKGNSISPSEYYTSQNYEKIIELHRAWMSSTIREFSQET